MGWGKADMNDIDVSEAPGVLAVAEDVPRTPASPARSGDNVVAREHEAELRAILRANGWFMRVLEAVRACNPPDGLVGAGVIRTIVWDHLHGYVERTPVKDVDVAFFDPDDLSPERDRAVQRQLIECCPDVPWEATNQAAVHTWYERMFGFSVPPLESVEAAVATWPETAVCVGVRLRAGGDLEVVAPFGLGDLFDLVLRRNSRRVSLEEFQRRVVEKQVRQRWPRVQVIDG